MDIREPWSLYATPRNAVRQFLIACHGAGEQTGFSPPFRQRKLPTRGLVYISAGHGTSTSGPGSPAVTVQAPAVIWLFPGVEHGYGPDAAGWSEHWILFAGESFAAFEELGLGNRHQPVLALERVIRDATVLFDDLRTALTTVGARSELAASLATQRILLAIVDAAGSNTGATDLPSFLNVLTQDAPRQMSVAARARRVGMSVGMVSASVKDATGRSLNDFVIEVRIAKAQALLAETQLDIGVIAERVGYGDAAYFSRLFTRRVGVAPTVFRLQQARSIQTELDTL
ncbi:helix-turn-helix domain-containing protein [Leifsonia kafniensis]|uniref:Helix-turn-helix domain-containing protein n=1 Tax=Leifsonia kafniensis TaxID=475957 RepID=A0ABP7K254_9MICO